MSLSSNFSSILIVSGVVIPSSLTVFLISKNSTNNLQNLTEILEVKVSFSEEEVIPVTPKKENSKPSPKPLESSEAEEKNDHKNPEPQTHTTPPSKPSKNSGDEKKTSKGTSEKTAKKPSPSKPKLPSQGFRVIKKEFGDKFIGLIKQVIENNS